MKKRCWEAQTDQEDYKLILLEPGHEKTCLMSYANNKGADQPAHPRSLISTFVVRYLDSVMFQVSVTKISSLMLASIAEQASFDLVGNSQRRGSLIITKGSWEYLLPNHFWKYDFIFSRPDLHMKVIKSERVKGSKCRNWNSLKYAVSATKKLEPHHEWTCLCHKRTTKTQISLHIWAVWTAPLLFATETVWYM